jgi:putative cardiolipin synthase
MLLWAGFLIQCTMLASCRGLPRLDKRSESAAVAPETNRDFSGMGEKKVSRAAMIGDGPEAFATRVAMSRFAKQSLDMQYYIWDGDKTGTYLLGELLDAADRGVRVRLLLDDHYSKGIIDGVLSQLTAGVRAVAAEAEDRLAMVTPQALERRDRMRNLMKEINSGGRDLVAAALDSHPNIEVRMFNPMPSRKKGEVLRLFQMLVNFSSLNRRMHNKIFAADNQLAVVGGRNIADGYFGVDTKRNVRDLDLLLSGPAVQDVSSSFDSYWNSKWAVPIQAFTWKGRSKERLNDLRKELELVFDKKDDPSERNLGSDDAARAVLAGVRSRSVQAPVVVIADVPEKFSGEAKPVVAEALGKLADASKKEILIETAYFVPSTQTFSQMRERLGDGVIIRTLTNSLASTDQVAAHAGYQKHRKDLLKSGIEMYELRGAQREARPFGFLTHGARAGLHTKSVVFDRERVFVGTFNLDPRSAYLNTEIGVLVESPALASQVAAYIDSGMKVGNSWNVRIGKPDPEPSDKVRGRLYWFTGHPEEPVEKRREPDSKAVSRFLARFLSWMPIEKYL